MKTRDPLRSHARRLRREMTPQERHLWYDFLKSLPFTVHSQKIIGHYIVDFYVPSAKLVIELDGSQHYLGSVPAYDAQRTACFTAMGLRVVRYTNLDIDKNFAGVCQDILHLCK